MRLKIANMKGVNSQISTALKKAGYIYTSQISEVNREDLLKSVDLSEEEIDFVYSLGHLMKVSGLGTKFAYFLQKVLGISSLEELMGFEPQTLAKLIEEKKGEKHILKSIPTTRQVSSWIHQSHDLLST